MLESIFKDQDFLIPLLVGIITAIVGTLSTWWITKNRINKEFKKQQDDRLRTHLNNYLDSFLKLRKIINNYEENYRSLFDTEQIKSEREFDSSIKKIKQVSEGLNSEFHNYQFEIDSIASRLIMYDLEDYSTEISSLIKPIQSNLDSFETKLFLKSKDEIDYDKIIKHFIELDGLIKIQFQKIESATKLVYPK